MANTDANSWDEGSPVITDARRLGASEINALRKGVRLRAEREHTDYDPAGAGGWHREGSALVYYQATAPTTRPDNSTALDSADQGRVWVKSTDRTTYVWSGSDWIPMGSIGSFEKTDAGFPLPSTVTKSGLAVGTWLIMIYGTTADTTAGNSLTISASIEGTIRSLVFDTHPGGTAPFVLGATVVISDGTLTINSITNIARMSNIIGTYMGN